MKEQYIKKEVKTNGINSRNEVKEKEDDLDQKPSPTLFQKVDKLYDKFAIDEKKLETVVKESKTIIDEIVAKASLEETTKKSKSLKLLKEEKEHEKIESKTDDEKAKDKAAEFSEEMTKSSEQIPDEDRSPDLEDTDKIVSEMKEMNRMDRRCSDLIEGMSSHSQSCALVRIDTSHVARDLSLRFSKTPPPSPVDLNAREKAKGAEIAADKQAGLQPKGPDTYLDASCTRLSPKEARASSAGDSVISETEAHQSELLTGVSSVLQAAATPKSPIRHLADNLAFVNVDQPTITTGAKELVDRTIETSINVIDQIKMEQHAAKMEQLEKDKQRVTNTEAEKVEIKSKEDVVELKTINIAELSDLKFEHLGSEFLVPTLHTEVAQYDTVVTHTETETRKISGQEYFTETKHVSSSDDDSLVIKMETVHEVSGQEHEVKHKTVLRRDKGETEIEVKKTEKAQEVSAKRSDMETKTTIKSSDDTDVVVVQRQFLEQGLYAGRQTKSEEKMSAIKDDIVTKTNEVTYSERDLHHEQWGKEYFTEGSELEDIKETDDDSLGPKDSFIESSLQIVEKDESISTEEISEKGIIVSSKTNYTVEESIVMSKEHDNLSDMSHGSARSESMGPRESEKSEVSPKSRSKSFKKDNEVYEVDFITEIKVSSASPVSRVLSRGGSQDTQSESDLVPDEILEVSTTKTDSPSSKSPIRQSQEIIQKRVLQVSVEKQDSFEKVANLLEAPIGVEISPEQDEDTVIIDDETEATLHTKLPKDSTEITIKLKTELVGGPDESPREAPSEDHDTQYRDIMIKSGESVDTEYMIKSLESQEAEALQKSIDSVSAETLHPSEFSTEADSAVHTGTEQKKEEHKFIKEKSLEDICSSGYDTDLSSAEFHATKLDTEHEPLKSTQPLTDLSVLEKTIDEVKQSLEAAQGEIIGEKSDGSSAYKQSPSEFEFKLISPDKPEAIAEEPVQVEDISEVKSVKDGSQNGMFYKDMSMSQDETQTVSDEDKDTIIGKDRSSTLTDDMSGKSDSGPHSILETESDVATSDRDESSKGSPDVKLRQSKKHVKTKIKSPVDRRSGSDVEGWSNSGESHYQSFEHTESPHSRPLSSDVENLLTATADFETALTTQDVSSQSLRTSKDFYTAPSSFTSRDSMKSLDSESSSQLASIDISDASETLVPSAHELKEELMESSNYTDNFLPEQDSHRGSVIESVEVDTDLLRKIVKGSISGDEVSPVEEVGRLVESVSADSLCKMKRSHEMRFQPKELIPEKFSLESVTESLDLEDASIKTVEKDKPSVDAVQEKVTITSVNYAIPKRTYEDHTVTHVTRTSETTRELADITSEIIPVGSSEYEQIVKSQSTTFKMQDTSKTQPDQTSTQSYPIDSKQSSSSSLKIQELEYLSTPQTPISLPSQSSESTENGREYVLDEMYEISAGIEARRLEKDLESKSELSVTTDERTLYAASAYAKDQDSPISDEFEMVDKPNEMDDFVVIEEVAREAQETDMEGKSLQIKKVKYEKKHDEEVEEYLSKTTKKQDSEYSTSGSLSEEEMIQYEAEQKRLKLVELAEVEAGKKWIQMQFEGEAGRYEYERVPLEDIKEEEMTDFDASRIGSLSSQKESIGSYGSLRNSYGSLSESEMMSRRRFMIKGEQDDISISSLQEFENLEQALIEQYQQHSSSSQDSLNGSLPRRYQLSKSAQGDDVSIASLKEFEGLESACIEALKVEIEAKQKEAQLLSQEAKSQSSSFIDSERRSHSLGSSECSPPQKSGSPSQKSGSPSQKSGSPSLRDGSPSQKQISQLQKSIADSPAIRKLIDQQFAQAQEKIISSSVTITGPTIVTVQKQKFDERGAFFTPTEGKIITKPIEIAEPECVKRSSFSCATEGVLQASLPGDCEEMMKILDQQELERKASASSRNVNEGVIEVIRTTKVIQQKFVDGKKVSENVNTIDSDGGVDIPGARIREFESMSDSYKGVNVGSGHSFGSEMSSSATSQQSDMDSLITMMEKPYAMETSSTSSAITRTTIHQIASSMEKPTDLQIGSEVVIKEISPTSGRTIVQTIVSSSGKHVPDPASGSWSGQEEDLDSSGSFSRARDTDLMLGSTDSLEATSSNATRATYNYEVDTPMTGSLTSGVPEDKTISDGSHTMVSSLDTLDPVTAFCLDSLEHGDGNSYSERVDYEIHEPDSETDRMEMDTRAPRAKARTVMFDSSDTLSAASQGEEGTATFFIGDTPIVRGEQSAEEGTTSGLSLSCPSGTTAPPIPAQRRSLSGLTKLPPGIDDMEIERK